MIAAPLLAAQPAPSPPDTAAPPAIGDDAEAPAENPAIAATGSRSAENAVRQAGDAFGTAIGREVSGLYNRDRVRGFSPVVAGNVRIDGLYFDPVFFPSGRISGATTIRVGPMALGSPFPSPTGIVDQALRVPGDKAAGSLLARVDNWGSRIVEADVALPLSGGFSLGLGGQASQEHFGDGTRDYYYEGAAIARWQPAAGVRIVPFVSLAYTPFHEAATIYVLVAGTLPPRAPRDFWNGPRWQRTRETELNAGLVGDADLGGGWALKAGLFRSSIAYHADFTNLLTGITGDGRARAQVIVDPPLLFASTSGEVRATRTWHGAGTSHRLHLSLRGRDALRRFGGAQTVDLGATTMTSRLGGTQPPAAFGPQERDVFRQFTLAAGYEGRWQGIGELSVGVQRTDYHKRIGLPGLPGIVTRARPLLFNANGALSVTPKLALYGGYVTGLEESGIAPEQAVNRNAAQPAIRTRQIDGGLRWSFAGEMRLVMGLFQITKPYFNLDAGGVFRPLGETSQRGLEASISGPLTRTLTVVAGTVQLRPRVTADLPGVGRLPVGTARSVFTANADWRPPFAPGLSLDAALYATSHQVASVDNRTTIPPQTFLNVGARYRFRLARQAALLRVQIENLTDQRGYELYAAGAFRPLWGRALAGYLTVDF